MTGAPTAHNYISMQRPFLLYTSLWGLYLSSPEMQTCWCPVGCRPAPVWQRDIFKHSIASGFFASLVLPCRCFIVGFKLITADLSYHLTVLSKSISGKQGNPNPEWELQVEYLMSNLVCISGVEQVLLRPADPCCPSPPGVSAAHGFSPASSWRCEGLPQAEGTTVHGEHWGYPLLPGRVYTRCQTTWCAHGAQPAGTCSNHLDTPCAHIFSCTNFQNYTFNINFIITASLFLWEDGLFLSFKSACLSK